MNGDPLSISAPKQSLGASNSVPPHVVSGGPAPLREMTNEQAPNYKQISRMKHEIRIRPRRTKPETNTKPEARNPKQARSTKFKMGVLEIQYSIFEFVSCFEIRISNFLNRRDAFGTNFVRLGRIRASDFCLIFEFVWSLMLGAWNFIVGPNGVVHLESLLTSHK